MRTGLEHLRRRRERLEAQIDVAAQRAGTALPGHAPLPALAGEAAFRAVVFLGPPAALLSARLLLPLPLHPALALFVQTLTVLAVPALMAQGAAQFALSGFRAALASVRSLLMTLAAVSLLTQVLGDGVWTAVVTAPDIVLPVALGAALIATVWTRLQRHDWAFAGQQGLSVHGRSAASRAGEHASASGTAAGRAARQLALLALRPDTQPGDVLVEAIDRLEFTPEQGRSPDEHAEALLFAVGSPADLPDPRDLQLVQSTLLADWMAWQALTGEPRRPDKDVLPLWHALTRHCGACDGVTGDALSELLDRLEQDHRWLIWELLQDNHALLRMLWHRHPRHPVRPGPVRQTAGARPPRPASWPLGGVVGGHDPVLLHTLRQFGLHRAEPS